MKPHKWAKEIKAWVDGAEIEYRKIGSDVWHDETDDCPYWGSVIFEYRIKPQPKEPQYLYVYKKVDDNGFHIGGYAFSMSYLDLSNYAGKIKLEQDE